MLRLGLKTVSMMGTHNIVYKFNLWVLHGPVIILMVNISVLVKLGYLRRIYTYLFKLKSTRPVAVPELGDDFLFARVRTLCFKSLFMQA